ncbi:MAG: hypothetical protein QNJ70_26125 [Xenococcaceae cyanobacterium MO_207.B15]|nr:hypothetical protein [Xenococcaceae cyanobacterium MO_207.B15]
MNKDFQRSLIKLDFIVLFVFVVLIKKIWDYSRKVKNPDILVLVINVGKDNIIQLLQKNGQVTRDNYQDLYTATQAVWIGSENEFSQHFENWFSENTKITKDEQSEYDVYLVKITLKGDDPGFKSDANTLERFDAFCRLPENSKKVLVSPRLPSKAYGNENLYNR